MNKPLSSDEIKGQIERHLTGFFHPGERVLAIIPDLTRSAPVPVVFAVLNAMADQTQCHLDYLIALGTHPPLSDQEIEQLVGVPLAEIHRKHPGLRVMNHNWSDPAQMVKLGVISADETAMLSEGLMREEIPVHINRLAQEYDRLLICGPVFPHEVAGFSGGAKYLFPGIAGEEIIHRTHWLGALSTCINTIGVKDTPVRRIIETAARMLSTPVVNISFVMRGHDTLQLFIGTLEESWDQAVELSSQVNIHKVPRQFDCVLSQPASLYNEIWTTAKAMYKLESVVKDGGDLIIYAPHINEFSITHGHLIKEIGYHCRDFFLGQWDKYKNYPLGVLAHSTHLKGTGIFENGVEKSRINVILATAIPPEICEMVNLGYLDPLMININDWRSRESIGRMYVPDAGETLFKHEPED